MHPHDVEVPRQQLQHFPYLGRVIKLLLEKKIEQCK
jgi:hypothetical protein